MQQRQILQIATAGGGGPDLSHFHQRVRSNRPIQLPIRKSQRRDWTTLEIGLPTQKIVVQQSSSRQNSSFVQQSLRPEQQQQQSGKTYTVDLYLVRHGFSEANLSKKKSLFSPDPLLVSTHAEKQPVEAGRKLNEILHDNPNPTIVVSSNMNRAMMTAVNMRLNNITDIYVSPNLKETLHKGEETIHGGNICLPSPDHQFKRILLKYPTWNKVRKNVFKFDSDMIDFKPLDQVIQNQSSLKSRMTSGVKSAMRFLGLNVREPYIHILQNLPQTQKTMNQQQRLRLMNEQLPFIPMTQKRSNPLLIYKERDRIEPGNFKTFIKNNVCKLLAHAPNNPTKINLVVVCHGKLIKLFLRDFYGFRADHIGNCDILQAENLKIKCSTKGQGTIKKLPNKLKWHQNPLKSDEIV